MKVTRQVYTVNEDRAISENALIKTSDRANEPSGGTSHERKARQIGATLSPINPDFSCRLSATSCQNSNLCSFTPDTCAAHSVHLNFGPRNGGANSFVAPHLSFIRSSAAA